MADLNHSYAKILRLSDSVLFKPGSRPDSRQEMKGKGRAVPDGELLAVDLNTTESGVSNGNPFQQMQLVEQQVGLTSSRRLRKKFILFG